MTPVREALDLLVSAGLAERVPYRGVRVREMSTKDVVEAYKWFLLAGAQGREGPRQNITGQEGQLTLEQIVEGKRRAQAWLEHHKKAPANNK